MLDNITVDRCVARIVERQAPQAAVIARRKGGAGSL
jgi:hypothetical protein